MSSNFKVLTIGDAMITMNPLAKGPLKYVSTFERKMGGAELNFAIGCARLGMTSRWISRLGNDEFGRVIYNFARGEGVDMSQVQFVDGHPTSINFKEIHEDGNGKTYYYRYQSPILTLSPEAITDEMFAEIDLVHLSGVFLAIDPQNIDIVMEIIKKAREKDIPISFDPNIRLKLWTIEDARRAYEKILPNIHIFLTGLEEASLIFGKDSKEELAELAKDYGIKDFVVKDGGNGSSVYRNGVWTKAEAFKITVVDTVGAGDGFDAGYIYGYLNQMEPADILRFANGVGALVTTVSGDNEGLPYLQEVNAFINKERVIER